MRDTIGWLQIQSRKVTSFRYDILCVLTRVTRKLLVVYGHSTYRMTALLSEMFIICVRELVMRYDWQVMAPNTHHSLFLIMHLCVFTHITVQHIQRLLYYWRHSLCGLERELHERSDWIAMGPRHAALL